MLESLMQHDQPLTLRHSLERMREMYRDSEVVTLTDDGVKRTTYGKVSERVDRLCRALEGLGVEQGDRVATFCWNSQEHLELYMAVPCMGAVLHTINIRLFPEQVTYIANHAEDKVVDDSLVPLLECPGKGPPGIRAARYGRRSSADPLRRDEKRYNGAT